MNKHFLLPLIACLCLGARAEAPGWAGWSAGLSLGATRYSAGWSSTGGSVDYPSAEKHKAGLLPGLMVGYDRQVGGTILGAELSHEFGTSRAESQVGSSGYPSLRTDRLKSLSGLTVRWGLPMGNNLLFVRGGLGLVRAEHTFVPTLAPESAFTASNSKTGLLLGVGLERRIAEAFSLRAEYLHFEGGKASYTRSENDTVFETKESLDTLRVGLSWRF